MKNLCAALAVCLCLAGAAFAGDSGVVAAIFPVYDWIREITEGSDVKFTLLLDKGVDLHSYQPSVQDIVKVAECNMFVYVGGESDKWVSDALKNSVSNKQIAVSLMQVLGEAVKHEEIIEGMEHEHEDHHDHDHDHDHEPELDEHVWLSLRNAGKICTHLAEKLSILYPQHSQLFSGNLSQYLQKLSELDKAYSQIVSSSKRNTILFADRFPFRYLVDDYGIKYYAAFSGCSAESEASFHTVKFLAEKVRQLNLPCVLTIEGAAHKIAQTVLASAQAKNHKILVMNSMQSAALMDVQAGKSYLSIMADNLKILSEALN
ncbi:MAG: zinc ABC transporter substrate-binding protein [Synergistaceae bacterium]|nr:zinc ABC transporter substrate-binding protein [Synergistaceae bacterium]MBR0034212.1 zinc ABC transporter substrate-binding protein [Synergistaceae bacterium]